MHVWDTLHACVNKYDCPLSCTCTAWRWQWVLIQRRGCPHHRPPGWRSHSCSLLRWNSWKYNFVEFRGIILRFLRLERFLPSLLSFYKMFSWTNLTWVFFIDWIRITLWLSISWRKGWGRLGGGGGVTVKRFLFDREYKGTVHIQLSELGPPTP